jgi:hypothetical protein
VKKRFRLRADEFKSIAPGFGGCFATDRITVDGQPVCFAYREAPDFDVDSGWRFFAGDESQNYADEPSNTNVYDVNTIANYDPDIVAFLATPAPVAFARTRRGESFAQVPFPSEPF